MFLLDNLKFVFYHDKGAKQGFQSNLTEVFQEVNTIPLWGKGAGICNKKNWGLSQSIFGKQWDAPVAQSVSAPYL